jgi:hypothetical protein
MYDIIKKALIYIIHIDEYTLFAKRHGTSCPPPIMEEGGADAWRPLTLECVMQGVNRPCAA